MPSGADKLKYDSTGAGEYVRDGQSGIAFTRPGGREINKDRSDITPDKVGNDPQPDGGFGKSPSSGGSVGGFARPGGAQSAER